MTTLVLATGIGLGITSLFYFIWLVSFGHGFQGLIPLELAVFFILLVFLRKIFKAADITDFPKDEGEKKERLLAAGFTLLLLFNAVSFLCLSMREPHGGWDGWAIWNTRARFLFRGAPHWQDALSPHLEWSHNDYPWLLPGTVARFWSYFGNETVWVPIVLACFFTFGTLGLLFYGLKSLKGRNAARLAGIVLLGTPFFITHGSSQSADLPLAFLILATFLLFCLHDSAGEKTRSLLIFAGMTGGLAAWTKNEGLLFLAALLAARIFLKIGRRQFRELSQDISCFCAGMIPILLVVGTFKFFLAPPNDLLGGQGQGSLERLTDLSRYSQILGAFYHQITNREWNWLPLFLFFYALIAGVKVETKHKTFLATALLTFSLMLVGYFVTYLLTPRDLAWHLDNSLNRLLLQLWPSALFAYFLAVCVPQKMFSGRT